MCRCRARGLTACLVCCGLLFAPLGAKNPPAAAIGHVLTAVSSTATMTGAHLRTVPDAVTGAAHRLPIEQRAAMYEPDKSLEAADIGLHSWPPWFTSRS
jgi:hypothetical protein